MRDGLSGYLSTLPCARLQLSFDPDTATLHLRGHLPDETLRAPVLAALQAEMGSDITLSDRTRLLPRPQCGILAGIESAGLPQSNDQITNPLLMGADAYARVLNFSGGDQLYFALTTPEYPAYVYVDYFDASGSVLHLIPNATTPLTRAPPHSQLDVGARTATGAGLQITVAPPYGQEIAVAFAASHPLFSEQTPRPIQETAVEYLEDLQRAVSSARASHANFKGEWVYFLVVTTPPQ